MSQLLMTNSAEPQTPNPLKGVWYIDIYGRACLKYGNGIVAVLSARDLPNFLRNSGFWFAQRQAPAAATAYSNTTGRAISADGWGITNENVGATYQRTDASAAPEVVLQGRFYGQFVKTTSAGKLVVSQVLEGSDVCALRGRMVRFQVWMKQLVGVAPVIRLGIAQLTAAGTVDSIPATFVSAFGANGVDPTLGLNLSLLPQASPVAGENCTLSGSAMNCVLGASWNRYGACFYVPLDCKNLVVMLWGANQFAATNGFAVANASLTNGYEVQDWSPLLVEQERARVQRFYHKSFNIDTGPVQNAGVGTGEFRFTSPVTASTAFLGVGYRYPTPMRAAGGTLTLYNPSAANAQVRNITNATDCTASAITVNGEQGILVAGTTPVGAAVGNQFGVHLTADAEL